MILELSGSRRFGRVEQPQTHGKLLHISVVVHPTVVIKVHSHDPSNNNNYTNTITITLTLDNYGEGQRKHLFTAIKIFILDLLALHYDAVLQGIFVIDTCVTGREKQ